VIRRCPALLVGAPASGQGKTTVTAALARAHRRLGRRVRVFKTGPDFLDPMILERASDAPVHPLDLYMGGEAECRRALYDAASEADLILVEGAMGLFDGSPSSADLAARFGLPVLVVIDASAMAQTYGAVAYGLGNYRSDIRLAGVFANRVAGAGHHCLLAASLPAGLADYGWLARDADIALPERHLGLVQAAEVADLDARIRRAADALLDWRLDLPEPVAFAQTDRAAPPEGLRGARIGVAHDAAFSFLYRANLELLAEMGAEVVHFSPLADAAPPECDALWLPGGYPELHLDRLAANVPMRAAIRAHHAAGRPILAECGGMLYLAEFLADARGQVAEMVGLLPARAALQPRLVGLGPRAVDLPEGMLRGHTFHHSSLDIDLPPLARATTPAGEADEAVYRLGRLTASYLHLYFPSNPEAVARLFLP
jgi:cobyrinic acid a,c-diamide synthase